MQCNLNNDMYYRHLSWKRDVYLDGIHRMSTEMTGEHVFSPDTDTHSHVVCIRHQEMFSKAQTRAGLVQPQSPMMIINIKHETNPR